MRDGNRVGAGNAYIAREVHGALHRGRAPTGTVELVSRDTQILLDLNDTEKGLLEYTKKRVKPSSPNQSPIKRGYQILSSYKKCHKIVEKLDESHLEHAKEWINQERFICHSFGGIFSHAFPRKIYQKLSQTQVEDIINRIRESPLPKNVIIDTTIGGAYRINHLGFVGMTQEEASNFMREVIADLIE